MSKIICPTDCSSELLDLSFSPCAPDWNKGGINRLYLANIGYPLLSAEGDTAAILAELLARISNTSTDVNAIRVLTIVGNKPVPSKTEIPFSDDRTIYTGKDHILNFSIDETGLTNYDFLRQSECNFSYLAWWANGKYLNGGSEYFVDGQVVSITMDENVPESTKDIVKFIGVAKWTSDKSPNKIINPLI